MTQTKEHLINPRVRDIQISGIRRFFDRMREFPDAISLTIGQPDFPTPAHVSEAAKRAIDAGRTTYTPNAGIPELRRAAAAFFAARYGLHYNPDTEMIVTLGATQAIDIALRTILDADSEVVLPGPVYPGYDPLVRLCGARPVYVDTRDTGFKLAPDRLAAALTPRTRCVILPYPSNPTGAVLSRGELAAIAQVLEGRDLFILADEIYSELIYDGEHHSIAGFPSLREQTVVINGLSKSHAMTGWRIGFTLAPAYLTREMLKVHQYNVSCASSVSQYAALEALQHGADDARPMRETYARRRDYAYQRLIDMGFEVVRPGGAFYLFPSIRPFSLSSWEFADRLLTEAGVAVVPGHAFSEFGEGYVRISYACDDAVLAEALDRMERFVARLRP
ncbi:aminotransferase A [Alicyclobacillus shizuokensis]|uniref:aminotransferase A n=1 Tax=Alicyclobacillus shizuokensis TaxID=392014 RepID=UPI0008306135|nr:aminotransferase A [Alicyclobacillus shizuokensis]MCL6626379.1 aminotransferase A [Alicyclobacillus shizuokensis]